MLDPKRSWDRGIRYSATHPAESTRVATSQIASQLRSSLKSLNVYTSFLTPRGLTLNRNAVRRSWYESMITCIQSL